MPTNFIQITPFMVVDDLERAVKFFTDILGFRALIHSHDYAYLHRETAGIRILEMHGPEGAPPGNRRFSYYIDVRDVDALYAELKPKLDNLPKADVHGPANKPTANANSSSSLPTATSSPSAKPSTPPTPLPNSAFALEVSPGTPHAALSVWASSRA